jgi:NitT/TauT family transport system substrate-binding protein
MKRSTILGLAGGMALIPIVSSLAVADEIPLRMATINTDSGAQPFYAQDAGFFKAAGLKATFQEFNNGQAIAAAVAGGSLDIAVSNIVSMGQAHAQNVPFVIVAPGALYVTNAPSTLMLVPKDSPIKSARDFVGKTVACNGINGIPQYCIRAWVDKAGGDSSTMKFVEMNFAQMTDALAAARIDGACVTEPFITGAKAAGRVVGKPFDACATRFTTVVYIAMRDWAMANRDTVKRFQAANFQTAAWANKNQDKTADILMKYSKLPPSTVQTMTRAVFAEKWNVADGQPLLDLTAKYGNVPDFPFDEIVFRG